MTMFKKYILSIVLLLSYLYSNAAASQKDNLSIKIASSEYPPYSSEHLKDFGIDNRIVKEAFALVGVKVEYDFFPSARSFKMAKTGIYDATMPWAKREGIEKYFYYSAPIIQSDTEYFYYLKDTKFKWDIQEQQYQNIKDLRVGAILGNNYGKKFQNAEKEGTIKVVRVTNEIQSLKQLLLKRVDLVSCKKRVCDYILKTKFPKNQINLIKSRIQIKHIGEYDYLLFSKKSEKSKQLKELFSKGLILLKLSKKYKQIIDDDFYNGYYFDVKKD